MLAYIPIRGDKMGNRIIRSCILEIFISVFIIVFSVVVWEKIDLSYYNTVAKSYSKYTVAQK